MLLMLGGLSDWQEDVTIKVMCEYYPYDDSAEIAMKISEENWKLIINFLLTILTVATKTIT